MKKKILLPLLPLAVTAALGACDALPDTAAALQASGIVEATQVSVAPELGGRVAEVFAQEGDLVAAGDPLFRLEDELLAAQRAQVQAALAGAHAGLGTAAAGLEAARAAVEAAQAQVHAAQVQRELALTAARAEEAPARAGAWAVDAPDAFDLPVWYFNKAEAIAAAQAAVQAAGEALETERAGFAAAAENAGASDLLDAEARLAAAQAEFLIAETLLARAANASGEEAISEFTQDLYDSAEAELEAAQRAYNQLLSETASSEVLEARARLAVARERHALARDRLDALLTGEHAPALAAADAAVMQAQSGVALAQANVRIAEAGVVQAEALVGEAQAALALLDAQLARLTVRAPMDGVVLVRSVEPGEVLAPGSSAMRIGRLSDLQVTVYIPENRYGQVRLGDDAGVHSDSFPGRVFSAQVVRIADQAEFTPRNVQTAEDRSTTVYAVELALTEGWDDLKPGMPVDVIFNE